MAAQQQASEQEEVEGLGRVLTRLALTEDDRMEQASLRGGGVCTWMFACGCMEQGRGAVVCVDVAGRT